MAFFLTGVLTTVVGIFYLLSWHLGAVEAISLSILVGTSVDYCVHLVEGYIMAGNFIPQNLSPWISHSDALPLSHRDSTVREVYYKVHMTHILHTARISNVDSVMFINRIERDGKQTLLKLFMSKIF